MSWNYRIVRYANGQGFGLHEVYYDDDGKPKSMTIEPAAFVSDTDDGPGGVLKSVLMAALDAEKYDVFDEPEEWK